MGGAGIGCVIPHQFGHTIASVIIEAQGALLDSELLRHTDLRITTMRHYFQRNETVEPPQ